MAKTPFLWRIFFFKVLPRNRSNSLEILYGLMKWRTSYLLRYGKLWKLGIKYLDSIDFKVSQHLSLWFKLTNLFILFCSAFLKEVINKILQIFCAIFARACSVLQVWIYCKCIVQEEMVNVSSVLVSETRLVSLNTGEILSTLDLNHDLKHQISLLSLPR